MLNDSADEDKTTKVCSYCHKAMVGDHKDCPGAPAPASLTVMPDPLIGTIFAEKYEIMSILGKGGMSLVYKAKHKFMDRVVAVKVLLEHLVTDQGAVQRFQQESKAASTLNHQNIVTVYDFGQTPNGQAYFVMDCLEGATLSDVIENDGRVAVPRALEIFEQICDGLEHAHQKGIIHRDLKPNNIVLMLNDQRQESVKIVDFGIAKILGTDGTPQQRLTQTGEIFGSPFYMSPEQCQGLPLDSRSDLYSLGCLMFETLTGFPPQMGDSFVATALKHINDAAPSFNDVAPSANIPKQVEYVVQKCLEKSPGERFATAGQVRQALMDAALAAGIPGLRAGAVKETSSKSAMRQTWDKLGNVFDTGSYAATKQKKKVISRMKIMAAVVPSVLLAITLSILCFYPGPEEDRGTPGNKLLWQFAVNWATYCAAHGDFDGAKDKIKTAKSLTSTFEDRESRLLATVHLEADIARQFNDFDLAGRANMEAKRILIREAEAEATRSEKRLQTLHVQESQDPLRAQSALQSGSPRILITADKLHGLKLYTQEEKLLRSAIREFKDADLTQSPLSATFQTELADCMMAQQKLEKVRPLLAEALRVRENHASMVTNQFQTIPRDKSPIANLIASLLKIGEFDRDQSNFPQSQAELGRAKKLIDTYGNQLNELLGDMRQECENSIVDLHRQMKTDGKSTTTSE